MVRWGLIQDLLRRKWLHVIINDDGVLWPITPALDNRPWQISHNLLVYIQSLTTAPGSRLFGSVVRALDFFPADRARIPRQAGIYSTMLHSFVTTFMS